MGSVGGRLVAGLLRVTVGSAPIGQMCEWDAHEIVAREQRRTVAIAHVVASGARYILGTISAPPHIFGTNRQVLHQVHIQLTGGFYYECMYECQTLQFWDKLATSVTHQGFRPC